jgi:Tfp pilus assembly protein PilV
MKVHSELSSPSRNRRVIFTAAFSLLEVLIAMVVVGTSAVAMFSGINTGFFTMQLARENLRATQIMLEKTETLRLYNWDQISALNTIAIQENYDPYNTNANSGIVYTGNIQITNSALGTSYSSKMKLVTVTLNWMTGGLSRTRSFTTYITQNGLQAYIY